MKKILILLALIALNYPCFSQKIKTPSDTAISWSIYRNALKFNDLDVAKSALFEILAHQPGNQSVYDSLAHLYFRIGAYDQALIACEKAQPTGAIKEIRAYSYRNLGDIKTALPLFEQLFSESSSMENGYQVASMQYSMKRYGECMETAIKIKNHPDAANIKVLITTEQGDNVNVPYLAAAENLMGVVYLETGKPELAKISFENALKSAPEFTLAKKNLASLNNSQPIK